MKVLIVEDEKDLSRSIVTYLRRENYHCDIAHSAATALEKIRTSDYDCIVLEIMLPDRDGFRIVKHLQQHSRTSGVIVISAGDSVKDRVDALNLGADDYLVKPFHFSELHARIGAIIRRKQFQGLNTVVIHELTIDLAARTVKVHKNPVGLTRTQFDLLLFLITNKNRVISKHAIAENVIGGNNQPSTYFEIIYSHIKNLKKKLAEAGCNDYIKSVYGMGYRFSD